MNGLGWGATLHMVEEVIFWVADNHHEVAQEYTVQTT